MEKSYFKPQYSFLANILTSKTSLLFLIVFLFISTINSFGQTITGFSPVNACYNSYAPITISGSGFTGVTAVEFNGVPAASFSIDMDTQITAVLPTSASSGNITVTKAITATCHVLKYVDHF
jgi:expansin (peptidoglycan-binding protein)